MVDVSEILHGLIVFLAGSATLWLFAKTWKNSRDINAMFRKVRRIHKELGLKDE